MEMKVSKSFPFLFFSDVSIIHPSARINLGQCALFGSGEVMPNLRN